jgi:hypothetical protein
MSDEMILMAINDVKLPATPFLVLGVILIASLAVFLWMTRKHH